MHVHNFYYTYNSLLFNFICSTCFIQISTSFVSMFQYMDFKGEEERAVWEKDKQIAELLP